MSDEELINGIIHYVLPLLSLTIPLSLEPHTILVIKTCMYL
jgi:hypothetical protein